MVDAIKEYLGIALLVVIGGLLVAQTMRLHKSQLEVAGLELEIASERAATAIAVAAAIESVRKTEQDLGLSSAVTRKETNEAIRNLTAQRDSLLRRLLNAEANGATSSPMPKASAAASTGGATQGSDGTQLPGTIGSEDVEEALRADTIRLQLAACYRQYNKAREALSR